jgi:L-histidine N-alpha-methyltransferase
MTTFLLPTTWTDFHGLAVAEPVAERQAVDERLAAAVYEGLGRRPKRLPAWMFYDRAGSRLFDEITERPEYYLTRTESAILEKNAGAMIARAADGRRLHISELGAGSAGKTRLLLRAALERQSTVVYEPLDVSASALEQARRGIQQEIPGVAVKPRVTDYTEDGERESAPWLRNSGYGGIDFEPLEEGDRRLVLYIGSSIGNFDVPEAIRLLSRVRSSLHRGDAILLGADLVKDRETLLAAYDDFAGVTADFNLNMLDRLNYELGAEFALDSFEHCAVWNAAESRIEMHLKSRAAQRVMIAALNFEVEFAEGETIHTESSYKYTPGQIEAMLSEAGFTPEQAWTDARNWFTVCLGRAE